MPAGFRSVVEEDPSGTVSLFGTGMGRGPWMESHTLTRSPFIGDGISSPIRTLTLRLSPAWFVCFSFLMEKGLVRVSAQTTLRSGCTLSQN